MAAVLDMGASAIRLVIAEIQPRQPVRILDEAARGVPLGRDVFSSGVIRSDTVEAALAALEGFRTILDSYGVLQIRAVATSAVREARNGEMFLDRIRGRTGIAFEIINEAEESRLVYLAVRQRLSGHGALKGEWTLVVEVGGGSTDLTLLRRGRPNRSGVYALGAIRMRQQLNLKRQSAELQVSLIKRYIANFVAEIRVDTPLNRVTHMIAIGGDVRFAASHLQEGGADATREIPRAEFLAFCDQIESTDQDGLAERFRLPAVEAETLVPALLVYRTLLAETRARKIVVSDASLRGGVLLDMAEPGGRLGAADFERQVLASADALGVKYRYDRPHGRHVAMLSMRLFDALQEEHGLTGRERLLLQVAALLHDIGVFVNLRGHHKHSQYVLAASQIFGLSDTETAMVGNIARYHRRGLPQKSHLPYVALDRPDRLIVNKLAAILRIANALDAEHLQKIKDIRLVRHEESWILELDGAGDVTMERMVAAARADMFAETYGRKLVIPQAGASE
jgi:exopolyphosphatase / guanosine-5'-triphosphate,3'-diphosphate pyrophosphatase